MTATLLTLALAAGASFSQASRPSLLLITIDTLRADRVGAYGHREARTPRLDALAAEGALYENAFTHTPVTLPAHATLLTGRLPHEHGVRSNSFYRLPETETTLAEILTDAGYRTAAFVSAAALDRRFGLSQGFELYDDEVRPAQSGQLIAERDAAAVAAKAIDWLGGAAGESPFFLWVHFFDPHHPYQPPEPFRTGVGSSYDGEVAFCDREIGRLLGRLDGSGLRSRTLVVVTSDHGEGLGEHGEATHGIFLYNSTLRVPLILSGPGVPRRARDRRGPVGLVDVLPTVLGRLGVATPAGISGRDLFASEPAGLLYAETYLPRDFYNWSELRAAFSVRLKFIEAPVRELYDLAEDPHEKRNLASERPETVRQLAARIEAWAQAEKENPFEPDARLAEELRSIGYVGGGLPREVTGKRGVDRPDPKAKIGLVSEVDQALTFLAARDFGAAERKLLSIQAVDPQNFLAASYRADALFELGRDREAIGAYRQAIQYGREAPYYHYRIGLLYERLGEYRHAAEELARVAAVNPEAAVELLKRSQHILEKGAVDGALAYMEALKKLGIGGTAVDLALADVLGRKGLGQRALEVLEAALAGAPSDPRLLAARATLLSESGPLAEAIASFEKALAGFSRAADSAQRLRVLKALGALCGQQGELGKAERYFEEAAVAAPQDFESLANLALTRVRAEKADEALAPLGQALAIRPGEVRLLNLKAEIHYRRGELEASRDLLRRSLGVDGNQPRIVEALAEVEAKLKTR